MVPTDLLEEVSHDTVKVLRQGRVVIELAGIRLAGPLPPLVSAHDDTGFALFVIPRLGISC